MGMVIAGRWTDDDRSFKAGSFVRRDSAYKDEIAAETIAAIASEPGRFHLIASLSCPWSHRTTIVRSLKGLANFVPLQNAGGERVQGYGVNHGQPWRVPGTDRRIVHLHELYCLSDPAYTGGVTVPVLWDSRTRCIVSNESSAIMRGLDAVRHLDKRQDFTLVPPHLRDAIDALNGRIHTDLSNAVYQAGLAQRQDAYDNAVERVFRMLNWLDERLSDRRYLFGEIITESDWRLFPTLVRFDAVYQTHFRCTIRRLLDYPNLWPYARDLFSWPGMDALVEFDVIREGYYRNDGAHNPFRIIAAQPDADWRAPHGRHALGRARIARRDGSRGRAATRLVGLTPRDITAIRRGTD